MARHPFLSANGSGFLIIATLFTLTCCSVKEDRSLCPCRVCFDYSRLLADSRAGSLEKKRIETSVFDKDGNEICRILTDGEVNDRAETELQRGYYTATTLICGSEAAFSDGRILRAAAAGADSLFGESAPLDAAAESAVSIPAPYKQFISVTLHFSTPVHNIAVELSAPSTAVDRFTLEGEKEPGTISAVADGESVSFRLLRQAGNDIGLSITESTTGLVIARIGLGSLLTKSGFDFRAKSLNDIDIYADLKAGAISIKVQGWESEPISIIF